MRSIKPKTKARLVALAAALAALVLSVPQGTADALNTSTDADVAPLAGADDGGPDCGGDAVSETLQRANVFRFTEDPTAGTWQTWHVDADALMPPAPPVTGSPEHLAELKEVQEIALVRTSDMTLEAQFWDDGAATKAWTELMLQLIVRHSAKDGSKNPPRLSRQFAMLETAMFDALAATYNAKYCYERMPPSVIDPLVQPVVPVRPLPSYPSEHAAVAGAASVLMASFFPCDDPINDPEHCEEPVGHFDRLAANASMSRLYAGTNYRSDIEAGLAIGRAVGAAVLAARANDGADAPKDVSSRIHGPCNWVDVRDAYNASFGPVEPQWGRVTPFLMTSGAQFRPGPPPACDGQDYLAQTIDLFEASKALTQRQKDIAWYWAGGQGTVTPPGQNLNIALNATIDRELSTMQTSRIMAHASAAIADAAIAAWDTKFTYWGDRPITAIHRLGLDPSWTPYIGTPPFPGYISGHSTFSGAASEFLAAMFPEDAVIFRAAATDAAMSRYYGGIHIRADNEVGLDVGGKVGKLAAARADNDGSGL